MTVLSTPIKNDIAMQKDLFRFSATLFAETSNEYSSLDSQLQMIKCIFLQKDNEPMSPEEIVVQLLDVFKYHISDDEVERVIKSHKKTFETVVVDDNASYKLLDSVLEATKEAQKNNIDSYIKEFIHKFEIVDENTATSAIYNYLYELTTTNINTYKLLISGKSKTSFSDSELSVDIGYMSEVEQKYIHDFIAWEDGDKNIALTNIVFTCLEYCLLINGDKPNRLLDNSIRKREIYLDTNVIFRALGINGPIRQKTVRAFLNKCKQARLKLVISHSTKKEFFDTIDYYLNEIRRYPRGNVYSGAYEQLSDYTLFSHYEKWRQTHPTMSLMYFKSVIQSSYEKMVREFGIIDDEKIPKAIYDSDEFKKVRNSYSATIKKLKDELHDRYVSEDDRYSLKDSHDATVVHYVEIKRDENQDIDLFFVSSDKILRYWDLSRSEKEYPVVIYPSQLFLVLIKTCGRSENDFDSFVSFINVRSAHQQIPAEKANVIISGISTITEDIKTQEILVSAICGREYQNVFQDIKTNDELYEAVQEVCKRYLEDELKEKESKIATLQDDASHITKRITTLEETSVEHEKEISSLRGQVEQQASDIDEKDSIIAVKNEQLGEQQRLSKKQKEKIRTFAEKKITPLYIFCCYLIPVILVMLTLVTVAFLLLQFLYKEESWNFAVLFFDWVKTTWFGEKVGDFVYSIDVALFGALCFLLKKFMRNPFNKTKNETYKAKLIQTYIKKNGLEQENC